MRQKLLIPVFLLCMSIYCVGCSYREVEDSAKEKLAEQTVKETNIIEETESTEVNDGTLVIHTGTGGTDDAYGPDSTSKVDFTIHDVQFYPSYVGVVEEAECTFLDVPVLGDKDKSEYGFLLMEIDVKNINYSGDSEDGTINMSVIGMSLKEISPDSASEGAVRIYLNPHGTGNTDYWHFLVKPGETKTCTMGFLLRDTDVSKLKDYAIAPCNQMNLGVYHDIPYKE